MKLTAICICVINHDQESYCCHNHFLSVSYNQERELILLLQELKTPDKLSFPFNKNQGIMHMPLEKERKKGQVPKQVSLFLANSQCGHKHQTRHATKVQVHSKYIGTSRIYYKNLVGSPLQNLQYIYLLNNANNIIVVNIISISAHTFQTLKFLKLWRVMNSTLRRE